MTLLKALILRPTTRVLIVRSMHHNPLLVQALDHSDQHLTLDIASDRLATLDHLAPAFILLTLGRQSDKIRQTLDEASLRIDQHLALQFVHPVLKRHHLTDRRLKIRIRTRYVTVIVYHRRLTRCQLRERPHIQLLSQAHLIQCLRKLQTPLHRTCALFPSDAKDRLIFHLIAALRVIVIWHLLL